MMLSEHLFLHSSHYPGHTDMAENMAHVHKVYSLDKAYSLDTQYVRSMKYTRTSCWLAFFSTSDTTIHHSESLRSKGSSGLGTVDQKNKAAN